MFNDVEMSRLNDQQRAIYAGYSPNQREQFEQVMRTQWGVSVGDQPERSILKGMGFAGMVLGGGYAVMSVGTVMLNLDQSMNGLTIPTYGSQIGMITFWVGLALFATGVVENRLIDINSTLKRRMRPAAPR